MTEKEIIEIKHGSVNMVDLLNQEQTELKKAMIEGIAEVIGFSCGAKSMDDCDEFDDCDVCRATDVYNAGYRKIPEGAVVLTREENEKWRDFLELNMKKARKETAREIIQLLDGHQFEDDGWTWSVSKRDLKFIAKKYGVEIEGGNKND